MLQRKLPNEDSLKKMCSANPSSNGKDDIDKRILDKKLAISKLEEELKLLSGIDKIPAQNVRPKYEKSKYLKRKTDQGPEISVWQNCTADGQKDRMNKAEPFQKNNRHSPVLRKRNEESVENKKRSVLFSPKGSVKRKAFQEQKVNLEPYKQALVEKVPKKKHQTSGERVPSKKDINKKSDNLVGRKLKAPLKNNKMLIVDQETGSSFEKDFDSSLKIESNMINLQNSYNSQEEGKEKPVRPQKSKISVLKPRNHDLNLQFPEQAESRNKAITLNTYNPKNLLMSALKQDNERAFKTITKSSSMEDITCMKKKWTLSEEESSVYGDRFPENLAKLDLLGKGGFALVWLAYDRQRKEKVAVKQVVKTSSENYKRELYFGQFFFDKEGNPKEEFEQLEGLKNVTSLLGYSITNKDVFLEFQLGGHTLSKSLFELKGQFFKGERVYQLFLNDILFVEGEFCKVVFSELYHRLRSQNMRPLKRLILTLAKVLNLFSEYSVIHSDLKPDNILIKINEATNEIEELKLIDFGSAFSFSETGAIAMATPEYMPPELLDMICNVTRLTTSNLTQIEYLAGIGHPWSIDIWSLGAIILEILVGVPHWISYKCKVVRKGRDVLKTGLFAAKGRAYDKIIAKQRKLCENYAEIIADFLDFKNIDEFNLATLLQKMLEWNPRERISPREVLEHSFLAGCS